MEHTIDINELNMLTPKDRNIIIRYCISIGTRAQCSTTCLLRPFKQKYLTSAFKELKLFTQNRTEKLKEQIYLYNNDKLELQKEILEYFDGKPSKKEYEKYINSIIKQERDALNSIKKGYIINVDYSFISKENLRFHNSLNPRVTFGYSNCLHEECDFILTEEIKTSFLNSSLKDYPSYKSDRLHDWGYVFFGSLSYLLYEDLYVFIGERCILDSMSHEQIMTVYLTDEEIEGLETFEGKNKINKKIIEKIKNYINK